MAEPDGANVIDLVARARAAAAAPAAEMFKVYSTAYTCQGAVRKLKEVQRTSTTQGWSEVEVCTEGEGDSAKPKLKCKLCNALLTVSNPAQSLKSHLTERACSGRRRAAAAQAAAAASAAASAEGGGGSNNRTFNGDASVGSTAGKRKFGSIMYATAAQQQLFEKSIARFFFKNGVPLQLIEDADLKAAVAQMGLMPPSRHVLSNKLLEEEYNAVRAVDNSRLARQLLIQFSSDGWRRRAAVGGKPLLNFMALLATGRPIFLKVISAAGEVKDKEWIAARHLEIADEATGGQRNRVLGFVMDNTKANMYVTCACCQYCKDYAHCIVSTA